MKFSAVWSKLFYSIAFILHFIGIALDLKPKSILKKTSPRPFQCDVCKRVFCSTEAKLNEHKNNFHKFQCQVCQCSFQNAIERDTHEIKQHKLRNDESTLSSDGDDFQTKLQNNYNLRKRSIS